MELRQYLSIFRKWLWLILLVALVAAGGSYFATSQQNKLYQATAKIMVGQSYQSLNPNSGDIATASLLADTYIQLIKTSAVLQGVKNELNLPNSVADLRNTVSGTTIQQTQFIEVRAVDTDPQRAAQIANAVADQLILLGPATSNTEIAKQREFVQSQIEELQKKIQDAEDQISQIDASIKTTTSVREVSDKRAQIDQLRNQVSQYQQNYTQFINYLAPNAKNTLSVLEPAEAPSAPFAPNLALNVGLATAVGVILALGVAFLIEYFDDTLKTKEDISRVLQTSTLGEIGALRGRSDKLVTANEPRSAIAEAYRMLRTNISFSSVDRAINNVLVTSASPSEGKSVTCANLAITMAQAGYRTLLLDCDLRKPTQHQIFNVSNDIGLTNCLLSHATWNSYVRPTKIENLRLLTTGPLPPNPAEILGSKSMASLLASLQADADVIVVDSPPVLAVADAAILSRMTDGVLVVVDSGQTRRDSARRAMEALHQAGGRMLGVVLNRAPASGVSYAYNTKYHTAKGDKSQGRSTTAPSSTG